MKRRDFVRAVGILPLASHFPFGFAVDWRERMRQEISSRLVGSEVLLRLGSAPSALPISGRGIFFSSDVKAEIGFVPPPWVEISMYQIFHQSLEESAVSNAVESLESRLRLAEAAVLRRAREGNVSGRMTFTTAPLEFYGMAHGDSVPSCSLSRMFEGANLAPNQRAFMCSLHFQMRYGL